MMKKKPTIIIFTDLDGSLLHRDTFKFNLIKDYIVNLINQGIIIIPNSSKTEKEILEFNKELGQDLPFISENGSVINGLNLLKKDLPQKLVFSRDKNELLKIFNNEVPKKLSTKCKWIYQMNKNVQSNILGLSKDNLNFALEREFTIPFIFEGTKNEKIELNKIIKIKGLTLQEGGRLINLCDKVSKAKSMQIFLRFFKKDKKLKIIAVGDNYNDLDMLKNANIGCLVFNDQFKQDKINLKNLIISNKPSPEGWADVIKMALVKLNFKN